VTASALALVQHASGREPTRGVPAVTRMHCVAAATSSLAYGVGRTDDVPNPLRLGGVDEPGVRKAGGCAIPRLTP
jgi:hypothetical protein